MKTFDDFELNEAKDKYNAQKPFTLWEMANLWSLDQILYEVNSRVKNKLVEFKKMYGETVKLKILYIIYIRYVRPDGKLGNQWKFIDNKGNEHAISVNNPITVYTKINPIDPLGEDDWEE
jgi:hypothetical protein